MIFGLLTNYGFPMLAGVSLMLAIARIFVLWQRERTVNALMLAMMQVGLFLVFLSISLRADIRLVSASYILFGLASLLCGFLEWRALVVFLRNKDRVHQEPLDKSARLIDVAESNTMELAGTETEIEKAEA